VKQHTAPSCRVLPACMRAPARSNSNSVRSLGLHSHGQDTSSMHCRPLQGLKFGTSRLTACLSGPWRISPTTRTPQLDPLPPPTHPPTHPLPTPYPHHPHHPHHPHPQPQPHPNPNPLLPNPHSHPFLRDLPPHKTGPDLQLSSFPQTLELPAHECCSSNQSCLCCCPATAYTLAATADPLLSLRPAAEGLHSSLEGSLLRCQHAVLCCQRPVMVVLYRCAVVPLAP
jgi:hypothetical protein